MDVVGFVQNWTATMKEKLCLQWNNFKENVNSAFGRLRNDKEFTDVTLACEDGQQIEAHKDILAASSPLFEKILQKNKHPHPMIYLKGFHSKDFLSIIDFLYFGEANVFQDDLDSFLAIAEEIQLKGLTGQTSSDLMEEQEKTQPLEPIFESKDFLKKSTTNREDIVHDKDVESKTSMALALSNQPRRDLQALDEKVKSMMEKSLNMIPDGKRPNGMPKQSKSWICKVCGKEGHSHIIKDHIEVNHLEGVSIPCDFCDKTFSVRTYLHNHLNKFHR